MASLMMTIDSSDDEQIKATGEDIMLAPEVTNEFFHQSSDSEDEVLPNKRPDGSKGNIWNF